MALTLKDVDHEYQIAIARNPATGKEGTEEEEEELFEINLEAVNNIPPPHYWESYVTETTNTLLANCLLPIADVSSAVPTVAKASDDNAFSWPTSFLVVESVVAPKLMTGFPSLSVYALQYKETNA